MWKRRLKQWQLCMLDMLEAHMVSGEPGVKVIALSLMRR